MAKYFKHRGVDNLVFARVTGDDNETDGGYKFGAVKQLAPVARVGKTVETGSNTEFYDNAPMFVINSEGADEIEIEVTALPLEILAELTGKSYDDKTGAMIDGEREYAFIKESKNAHPIGWTLVMLASCYFHRPSPANYRRHY